MTHYLRAYVEQTEGRDEQAGAPIRFVASTENIARDGLIIEADGWQLDNFRRNPVVLWCHNYMGMPPIGRATVWIDSGRLMADVTFDQGDPFACAVERKYRTGFLNAVSVGWDTEEYAPPKTADGAPRIVKQDLLEISAVPVPSDPGALKERQVRGLRALHQDLDRLLADDSDPAPLTADDRPDSDVAWEDLAAQMVRLFLPDTQATERERRSAYNHLAKQYRKLGKEAPEFRGRADLGPLHMEEIQGLFLEGEPDMLPDLFQATDTRAGAVLSARNRGDLERAVTLIQEVIARAAKEEADDGRSAAPDPALVEELGEAIDPTVLTLHRLFTTITEGA